MWQANDEGFVAGAVDFCHDSVLSGILHPGMRCYRQIPAHLTLASCPASQQLCFDGQRVIDSFDQVSPAVGRNSDGSCQLGLTCSIGHIINDVIPSFLKNLWPILIVIAILLLGGF